MPVPVRGDHRQQAVPERPGRTARPLGDPDDPGRLRLDGDDLPDAHRGLKEKARDYIAASRVLGASTPRILFRHLLPNTVAIMVTLVPFTVSGLVFSLTSLDYLGFGLPPKYATWGKLLRDGLRQPLIAVAGHLDLPRAGGPADPHHLRRRGGARGVRSEEIHLLPMRMRYLLPAAGFSGFSAAAGRRRSDVPIGARFRRVRAEVQPLHQGVAGDPAARRPTRSWRRSRRSYRGGERR